MKQSLKRVLVFILTLAMLVGTIELPVVTANAAEVVQSGTCGESLTWTLDDEGTLVISGEGKMKDYSYDVSKPWKSSDVKKLCIEAGVTSIGAYAFSYCSHLNSVILPEGVTSIGTDAFMYCNSLTSITIPEGVTNIGSGAFDLCEYLENITIPNSVTDIGSQAFRFCRRLKSITIPDRVTKINGRLFERCSSLTSIVIPENVTIIDGSAPFYECYNLKNIEVSEKNNYYCSINGILYNKDVKRLIYYGSGREETEFSIPDGVTSIGDYVFDNCSSLESIKIPESVTRIGSNAFEKCSSLKNITIPKGVTNIGSETFSTCSKLKNIEVSEENGSYCSVDGVLYDKNIKSLLYYGPGREEEEFSIPESVINIGNNAFSNSTSLKCVIIPEGVTSIGGEAFENCRNLKDITIPESVKSIGSWAFEYCSSLENITIPKNVTSLIGQTFYGCQKLKNIDVSEENSSYCSVDGVLYDKDMKRLLRYGAGREEKEYSIPNSVTNIEVRAFTACSNLESITIPESVSGIGFNTFEFCRKLENVIIWDGVTSIGSSAFYDCSSLKSVIIPKSVTSISSGAFAWDNLVTIYGAKDSYAEAYALENNINFIEHTHTYGTDWKSDADNHWHGCICGERIDEASHTEDNGTVTKEPTETETGLRTYKCNVCGCVTRTEVLPSYHTHSYGTDWKSSSGIHWYECSCGEKIDETAHIEDSGTVTKEPTEMETGIRTYKCSVCGYVMRTEQLDKLGVEEPSTSSSIPPSTEPSESVSFIPSTSPSIPPSTEPSAGVSFVPDTSPSIPPSAEPSADVSIVPDISSSMLPSTEPSAGVSSEPNTPTPNVPTKIPNISKKEFEKNSVQMNKKSNWGWNGNSLTVKWGKVSGAAGYDIYAAVCGTSFNKITLSVKNKNKTTAVIKRVAGKKVSKKKTYKVRVYAYRFVEGKKQYIGKSADLHVAGSKNQKYSNAKSIKLSKKKYSLHTNETVRIRAKIVMQSKKKKLLPVEHGENLRYSSSDTSVASVSKTGLVKPKKKGKCVIYVHALNGVNKQVSIIIK